MGDSNSDTLSSQSEEGAPSMLGSEKGEDWLLPLVLA
jgi:hypothetical protein